MATTIYVIRHGQASFGAEDYDQLSPLGEEQSRVLGASLVGRIPKVDAVWSGTLRRHRQTRDACLAAMGCSLPGHETADLDEFDAHDVVARLDARYAERNAVFAIAAAAPEPMRAFEEIFVAAVNRWVGGAFADEYALSWQLFRERTRRAIDALLATLATAPGEHKTALVFSSGGPIAALLADVGGIADATAMMLVMSLCNASVTKLVASRRGLLLSTYNEHPHFEGGNRRLITYR